MMDEFYTLQWRGRQTEPMSLDVIREALETGDIHSMYQIDDHGRWRLLRDFLEDHPVVKQAPPAYEQPEALWAAQPASPSPASSAVPAPSLGAPPPPLPAFAPHAAEPGGSSAAAAPRQGHGHGHGHAHPHAAADSVPMGSFLPQGAGGSSGKFPAWLTAAMIGLIVIILPVGGLGAYLLFRTPSPAQVRAAPAEKEHDSAGPGASSAEKASTASQPPAGGELSVEELVELKSPYVVEVHSLWQVKAVDGKLQFMRGSGTGVLLSRQKGHAIFITNRHVIQPPEGAVEGSCSIFYKDEEMQCDIVAVARHQIDLAKLQTDLPKDEAELEGLKMITLDHLKVGQECVAIGNSLGGGIATSTGVISRFDEFPDCKMIRTTAPISPGNSGGGLFRKKDGALVGITTGSLLGHENNAQNVNLAIPVDYILNELFWQPFRP